MSEQFLILEFIIQFDKIHFQSILVLQGIFIVLLLLQLALNFGNHEFVVIIGENFSEREHKLLKENLFKVDLFPNLDRIVVEREYTS